VAPRRSRAWIFWSYVGAVLFFLYLPLVPPLLFSFSGRRLSLDAAALTLRWHGELWKNPILVRSIETSLLVGALAALITPPLAPLAAMAAQSVDLMICVTILAISRRYQ